MIPRLLHFRMINVMMSHSTAEPLPIPGPIMSRRCSRSVFMIAETKLEEEGDSMKEPPIKGTVTSVTQFAEHGLVCRL